MLWIFPYLSVLKGNLSRSLGAIAYTEWFPNKLPCIFSREILNVVNRTISHSDCSAIAFGVLSSQGDRGDLAWRLLPNPTSPFLLKGKSEGG
ncbi:MAG: hypothetical protein ACL9RN_00015 [Cylindrospermopsis raciborskii]|uniref:hypothetical protein n=1 Tax=Cylindrospermopsis raciborskii TaxID=77022 RepID=UPI003D0BD2EE